MVIVGHTLNQTLWFSMLRLCAHPTLPVAELCRLLSQISSGGFIPRI